MRNESSPSRSRSPQNDSAHKRRQGLYRRDGDARILLFHVSASIAGRTDPDADCNAYGQSYRNRNVNSYSDSYGITNSDGYADCHGNADRYRYASGNANGAYRITRDVADCDIAMDGERFGSGRDGI